MNENLDLTKMLENCPIGTRLYSPALGGVEFMGIHENELYPINVRTSNGSWESFTCDGKLYAMIRDAECLLLPSRDQRDWSKFQMSKRRRYVGGLEPFDKVLTRGDKSAVWHIDFFEYVDHGGDVMCRSGYVRQCVPYNDETKDLLGTSDDCMEYYKYWEE